MKIRLAQDKDYAGVARLHRQTIRNVNSKDYPADIIKVWSGRSTAARFRNNADKCKRWVALDKNKIVGFCDHSFKGEFWGLYVHKDYVGKGVGSELLKTAEDSLKKMGCKKISLISTITAKGFYQKHGYKVIRKKMHPMGDIKIIVYLMSKNI